MKRRLKKSVLSFLAIISIVTMVGLGGLFTRAFLTNVTDPIKNFFSKAPKYTLTYHDNVDDEEIEVPASQESYGEQGRFTISTDKPLRNDFVFMSWNTKSGGDGTTVNSGSTYTTSNKHTDLYAQWEVGYTLIYMPNGGKDAPSPQTMNTDVASYRFNIKGQESMTHDNPQMVFLGWSEDPEAKFPTYGKDGKYAYLGTDYKDGDNTQTIEKDIELVSSNRTRRVYAVWALKYELHYEPHPLFADTTHGPYPQTQTAVTKDDVHEFQIPKEVKEGDGANVPSRDGGYYWGWWSDDVNDFDEHHGYGFDNPYKVYEDNPVVTLYACFQPPQKVVLEFDKNDKYLKNLTEQLKVTNWPANIEASTTELIFKPIIPNNIPDHPQWEFVGWARDKNATEPDEDLKAGNQIEINKVINNRVTIYAVWKNKHKFQLRFNHPSATIYYYVDGVQKYTSSNRSVYIQDDFLKESDYYTDTTKTWDTEFFSTRRVYAYRGQDRFGDYKFLGWSLTSNPTVNDVDYPVVAPVVYNAPEDGEGFITDDITVQEPATPCAEPTVHIIDLYAVFRRSPLHRYQVVFATNGKMGGTIPSSCTKTFNWSEGTSLKPSLDYPNATWTPEVINANDRGPTATKAETDTATYELIGWTSDKEGTTVEYTVDPDTKLINQTITFEEPAGNPADCTGDWHTLTLYPVFKVNPRHSFNLYVHLNAPSGTRATLYVYKDNAWATQNVGSKTVVDINGKSHSGAATINSLPYKKSIKELTETTETFNLAGDGLYVNAVPTSTASNKYIFHGWSLTKYSLTGENAFKPGESTIEFPINVASDAVPTNTNALIKEGSYTIDEALIDEQYACDDETGKEHNVVLYGVWTGDPLHRYSLIFNANTGSSTGAVLYGRKTNFDNNNPSKATGTINAGVKDWDDGVITENLRYSYQIYSDYLERSTTSYDFNNSYFKTYNNNNGLIVRASRDNTIIEGKEYRYTFLGWSYRKDSTTVDIAEDDDGYINTSIHVEEDNDNCDGSLSHNEILYAVWNTEQVHGYSIIFAANDSTATVNYHNGSSWQNKTDTIRPADVADMTLPGNITRAYRHLEKVPVTEKSHTWAANSLRVKATRPTKDGKNYVFLGWSTNPNATSEADVEYHVDADGYITDAITITDSDDECEYLNHNIILYAVYKPVESHNFKVTFNLNGGSYFRIKNSSNRWTDANSYSVTYPEDGSLESLDEGHTEWTWNNLNIGARKNPTPSRDSGYDYEFLGWSKTQVAITPTTVLPDDALVWTAEDGANGGGVLEEVTVTCENDPCEGGTHNLTLYAVFKAIPRQKQYHINFDLNDEQAVGDFEQMDGTEYYNGTAWDNYYLFEMPDTVPTNRRLVFVGWSEDPNATSGVYGKEYGDNDEIRGLSRDLEDYYPRIYEGDDSVKTLYAIWWNEYNLRYLPNGGAQQPKLEHAYASDESYPFTISEFEPFRDGYTFLGWSSNPNASSEEEVEYRTGDKYIIPAGEDGYAERELYAVWKQD